MFAFSTCWNSSRHTDGHAMLAEIRALGFTHAELGHATRLSLLDGIQRAVAAKEIQISSVHNFCPLPIGVNGPAPDYYQPSSRRDRERELAVRHTLRTLDCAASLGGQAVVLHLGQVPMRDYTGKLLRKTLAGKGGTPRYEKLRLKALVKRADRRQKYFDNVCAVLDLIVPRAKEFNLKLGFETRMGLHEIPDEDEAAELIRRYGTDVVGYWLDNAHAEFKEYLGLLRTETVLDRFRGRTIGMHLQDFKPPFYDHLPPGAGTYAFQRLTPFVTNGMIVVWEIHGDQWDPHQIAAETRRVHQLLRPPATA
jgi:sugar phosphate isomerase/epimerase